MRLRQRRDRVVLCRMTEQEHCLLQELCAAKGGRSLSEFVRVEVLSSARCLDVEPLRELASSLERRLSSLEAMQDELARRIQSLQDDEQAKYSRAAAGGQ